MQAWSVFIHLLFNDPKSLLNCWLFAISNHVVSDKLVENYI